MPESEMQIRLMTLADVPAGIRLKDVAGWNQTPVDWLRFLRASPEGCFAAEVGGAVVGTATTIVYEGRFAWIGMVLVDPEHRGRGIGTRLLERTIEHLDAAKVPTLKLDATPQGKPIYEKLGFVAEYEIERWKLQRPPGAQTAHTMSGSPNLKRLVRLDREIFGADRSALLQSLHQDAPEFTMVSEFMGNLNAYAWGRKGSRADHLGPWMAQDEPSARELLDEFLRRSARETVFVDVMRENPSRGFEFSRPLTRMYRGPNEFPGRPDLLCAVLGPEFG